jgi:predicted lipid-binding transport protein (Tim44 family)
MRTLLQMLVFGMVLYQHCTWPRLCILLAGSIILYATALWAPFRQFILSLAMPPRPEQLAEMQLRRQQAAQQHRQAQQPAQQQQQQPAQAAAAAAGGQQQQQQQDGGAAAPAAPAAAAPAEAGAPAVAADPADARAGFPRGEVPLQPGLPAWLQRGIVREVLAVLLSFITSLLPGWNYNAEDAAVFAAAQEMMAREAREQQQQGQGAAAGGAAAAGDGVNAAA